MFTTPNYHHTSNASIQIHIVCGYEETAPLP
jgi:hypothetical protein